jgi:tetratricopeptide (TPR) repeat protein
MTHESFKKSQSHLLHKLTITTTANQGTTAAVMASPMDPAEVKALMQSSNISNIEETVRSFDNHHTETPEDEQQLLKLRILLWNRILALQRAASDDYSIALGKIGLCWIGMGETDKAISFLVKALEMRPDDANGTLVFTDSTNSY